MNDFKLCHKSRRQANIYTGAAVPANLLHICIKYIYVNRLEDDSLGKEIKFTTTKQNVRQPLPLQYFIKDMHGGVL